MLSQVSSEDAESPATGKCRYRNELALREKKTGEDRLVEASFPRHIRSPQWG
jgi:hypothetical protein